MWTSISLILSFIHSLSGIVHVLLCKRTSVTRDQVIRIRGHRNKKKKKKKNFRATMEWVVIG
ncbi:hypothetical protein P175DRAFT_0138461 [Aspergillus ochraceoroseus IBT 24754]|uniref:Secreted protein n=1 Tax=Aspergillus ochraceoroseus IBT 24754 TaxID=1392256 RepID=A0A2T5M239_9EURO|nr:uncharacterized protein P175DRAFT_0138461 [Aspergillus ochraceoroseus IBT 24754]PTU22595.1 hypothetical protein P175DRAFT_0138461 [Aspergillus ochraceoroseus IBT 24754]